MGGQRWLDLGVIRVQPAEFMKLALVMAMARYFHGLNLPDTHKLRSLVVPIVLIILPAALVVRQPDLGTTLMLVLAGVGMIFLSGEPGRPIHRRMIAVGPFLHLYRRIN